MTNFGKFHITFPAGQTHEYVPNQPVISAGRAQDNQLIIEDTSVSRHHARFLVESGRLTLEDLGAANGTFIGGQRLEPNTSQWVPENQVVRLGDIEVTYQPPASPPAETGAAEAKAAGPLSLRLPIPLWLIPLGVVLLVVCCLVTFIGYVKFCPTYAPDLPFCPAQAKPVINLLEVKPKEVASGGTVVLSWNITGAETVQLTSPVQNTLNASGLQQFKIEQNTTFTIRATNPFGTVEQSVGAQVKGAPPVIQTFSANPATVVTGQTAKVVLSWTVLGADSVSIEGVSAQTFDPQTGNVELDAPTATTTYVLVATNAAGALRQEVTVVVRSSNCKVNNAAGLNLRAGPGKDYPVLATLPNDTVIDPFGRDSAGQWLRVQAPSLNKEGWGSADLIVCDTDGLSFPTVDPAKIPAAPPSATPTPPATPTPTPMPLFQSSGFITYRGQSGGRMSLYLQKSTGSPVVLLGDKDDVAVLDYTPNNGGLFALWAVEGGAHNIYIVRPDGSLVRGPVNGGWTTVTDGDWSIDGQHLVIEAVSGSTPKYYYYNANGDLTGQPSLGPLVLPRMTRPFIIATP